VRVLLIDSIHLILNGLTIAGGHSDENGGGLFISKDSELTITNSTIAGNTARHGGGLFNNGGKMTMTNCTISGNIAFAWGGGFYNNFGGDMSISLQTIAPQAGSPAIGAVPAQLCPLSDQRGYLRPADILFCDIGAYQSSYIAPPAPPSP
jgi:hypothetical protein